MPERTSKPVLVAAIAGAFGVRGELRLKSFTQEPAACLAYAPFVDAQGREILHLTASRPIKGGFAVRAEEVQTRDEAEALKSTRLYALREKFAEPEEDAFYQADLLGLRAFGDTGAPLGQIKAVLNFGAGDLLEIAGTPGVEESWTVPFTRHHVPVVDVAGGKVVLQALEDYLPDQNQEDAAP